MADGAGGVFIADAGNNRVRKVSTSGVITTVAGNGTRGFSGDGGPATNAQLNSVCGIAVDGAGNLFIADGLMPAQQNLWVDSGSGSRPSV